MLLIEECNKIDIHINKTDKANKTTKRKAKQKNKTNDTKEMNDRLTIDI